MRTLVGSGACWAWLLVGALACGGGQQSTVQSRPNPDEALGREDEARHVPDASTQVREGEGKLSAGDAAGARALFDQAIEANPDDARAHLDLGLVLESLGDAAAAEQAYRRAAEIDPGLAEAHNNLGVLLREKGDLPHAVTAFRAAISANPRSASAHSNLAMTFEDAGDATGAEDEYRKSIEVEPTDAIVRANLGLLLLAINRADDAKRELRAAVSHAQDNRAALVAIGNGLRRAGDPGSAVEAMRSAIAAGDGQPTPALLAELGLAQLAAGSRDVAIETLKQAIELDTNFAVGHYLLANMYAAAQQNAPAAKHYRRYLEIEPNGPQAAQARERLAIVDPSASRGRARAPR